MYRLGCIPILSLFLIKNAKGMCICEYIIFSIGTLKSFFFRFEKGYKQCFGLDFNEAFIPYSKLQFFD